MTETAPGSSADISIPAAPAAMVHTQRKRDSKPLQPQTEAQLTEKQLVLPKAHMMWSPPSTLKDCIPG